MKNPQTVHIPFNKPYVTGNEFSYMQEAIANAHLAGNGPFSLRCRAWLERELECPRVLLTHSCTGALEMSMALCGIGPGDEVVMPSFTFVSTATAVVAHGGIPVFVDVDADTFCIDPVHAERAVTDRTRAVIAVHYAGVACDMAALGKLCRDHGLALIEDAAHAIGSSAGGRALGTMGTLGALSFHETKNVSCGEGGALLVNDETLAERAEVMHEKGTDRQRFFRGQVDKYTWVDVGSSYVLSDLAAAFLWAQLEHSSSITEQRLRIWDRYHRALAELEECGDLRRPIVPSSCSHNGHMYYVVLPNLAIRTALIEELARSDVNAVFHYSPLHTSTAGRRYGRAVGDFEVTDSVSDRLLRLPLWAGMSDDDVDTVAARVRAFFGGSSTGPEH